ncbi:helix-turn-helix domain-containing protein [Desulfobacterales bacterium HSG2]|nr:helix-turn-helix domain-containing protein [Desulfobacterales bacterium HSG2]
MPYISLTKAELGEKDADSDNEEKLRLEKTKKIFRHPVRDRILGILRDGKPRTQRELGKILSMSNAAIHYHVKMLLEIGIISLHGTRPGPNGITEKLYTADIENWPSVSEEDADFYMDYIVSWMNERHREGLNLLKSGDYTTPFLAGSYSARARIEDMLQLKHDIEKLFDTFYKKSRKLKGDNLIPLAVTFSLLPSQEISTEDSRNILEFEPQS